MENTPNKGCIVTFLRPTFSTTTFCHWITLNILKHPSCNVLFTMCGCEECHVSHPPMHFISGCVCAVDLRMISPEKPRDNCLEHGDQPFQHFLHHASPPALGKSWGNEKSKFTVGHWSKAVEMGQVLFPFKILNIRVVRLFLSKCTVI